MVETAGGRLIVVGAPDAPTATAATAAVDTTPHATRREPMRSPPHLAWDLVADWEQLTAYPFMVQALEAGRSSR